MPADSPLRKNFTVFSKIVFGSHAYIALYMVLLILLHFLIEIIHEGLFVSGLATAILVIAETLIGAYGTFVKKKEKGLWLTVHRILAAAIPVFIIVHVAIVASL